jgi:hypothetical protein
MIEEINMLRSVTTGWTTKYAGRAGIKYGLIGAPGPYGMSGEVKLQTKLTDVATFNMFMAQQNVAGGGNEPTLDAILLTCDNSDPLGLQWTSGSNKVIVMYTDEGPQTMTPQYMASPPSLPINEIVKQQALDALVDAGIKIYTFTAPETMDAWSKFNPTSFYNDAGMDYELDQIIAKESCK